MLRLAGNQTCGCRTGNTFELNSRDVNKVFAQDVVYEPNRWLLGSPFNVGFLANRESTYPKHSICYTSDVPQLTKSGFKFENDGTAHGKQRCVGCRVAINWKRGMNADDEHRKANPDCPWLIRRDTGQNMELFVDVWKPYCIMYECSVFEKDFHPVCTKCHIVFAHDDVTLLETHERYSPNCVLE
jgi:hypothetical protein